MGWWFFYEVKYKNAHDPVGFIHDSLFQCISKIHSEHFGIKQWKCLSKIHFYFIDEKKIEN